MRNLLIESVDDTGMQSTISLRAPNIGSAPELAVSFVGSVSDLAGVAAPDGEAHCRATEALVRFALQHAYPDGREGEIAVETRIFDNGQEARHHVGRWGGSRSRSPWRPS
jgi:hypothetical protein